jgi:hypothetical protein
MALAIVVGYVDSDNDLQLRANTRGLIAKIKKTMKVHESISATIEINLDVRNQFRHRNPNCIPEYTPK